MSKLRVKNLNKVFGDHPQKALKMLNEGYSKDEIFKKTKQTVGVQNVSFEVSAGETFVIMGLSGSGKSRQLKPLAQP